MSLLSLGWWKKKNHTKYMLRRYAHYLDGVPSSLFIEGVHVSLGETLDIDTILTKTIKIII